MKRLDTTEKLFDPSEADDIAASMTEDGDGWTYVAVHDPSGLGWSFIRVYDEEGEFVGKL